MERAADVCDLKIDNAMRHQLADRPVRPVFVRYHDGCVRANVDLHEVQNILSVDLTRYLRPNLAVAFDRADNLGFVGGSVTARDKKPPESSNVFSMN